jgi:hypothetical protein
MVPLQRTDTHLVFNYDSSLLPAPLHTPGRNLNRMKSSAVVVVVV